MAAQTVNWKKRILIPFWVVRIAVMIFVIGIYAVALAVLKRDSDATLPSIAIVVVFMLLMVAVLLMDVLAIILFARNALSPPTFLIMNVIQTAVWAVVLILDIVAIAQGENAVGITFSALVFVTFIGLLIYASIGYHRHRNLVKRGHYAPTPNPANSVHLQGQPPAPTLAYSASPYQHQNTSYNSQTTGQTYGVQMQNPHQQQHAHGEAADYYNSQPAKPAHMV